MARLASTVSDQRVPDPTSTPTPIPPLELAEQCYQYAYLRGRQDLGSRLREMDELRYRTLSRLLEGDPERRRRRHRRFRTKIQAVVKTDESVCCGLVLNLSGAGMYLAIPQHAATRGTTIQVKLGRQGQVEYLFTCSVVRQLLFDGMAYLGLRFTCVPLKMQLGGSRR